MASIVFNSNNLFTINNLSGSGLGFFSSAGFGGSVQVGNYNQSTFITNSAGSTQGPQVNNTQWAHPSSGYVNGAGPYALTSIPNYLSTLNIEFQHGSAVKTQNCKLRIYDRSNINNNPSGVTCKVAEIIHPNTSIAAGGSGSSTWQTPTGSSSVMSLVASPGLSGLSPNGVNTQSTVHDHYLVIAASPDSVGSKTFALYYECEYL